MKRKIGQYQFEESALAFTDWVFDVVMEAVRPEKARGKVIDDDAQG
jgi:hypothetical protein